MPLLLTGRSLYMYINIYINRLLAMLRTQYALIIAGWPRPAGQLGPIRIRPYTLQM
jgi:hypothetical protein